jgi:hypothetical protein
MKTIHEYCQNWERTKKIVGLMHLKPESYFEDLKSEIEFFK